MTAHKFVPDITGPISQEQLADAAVLSHRVYVDIYEVRQVRNAKKTTVSFAFEDTASPPWHSPIYLPANIGAKYYQPMLGCTSVLDTVALGSGETAAAAPTGTEVVSVDLPTDNGVVTKLVEIPASLTAKAHTVAEVCELLSDAWLKLRESGADMDLFVSTYTNRAFASLYEMLGTENPHLSMHSKYRGHVDLPSIEGFHGNAFGRYSNLENAQGEPLAPAPLASTSEPGEQRYVDGRVDPRLARYERVEAHKLLSERRSRRTNSPENPVV